MRKTFSLLTESDWQRLLADAETRRFSRNETIIEEGSDQKHLYIIRTGSVRVARNHEGRPIIFHRLGPDEVVGEMSFLEHRHASASVVAESDVELEVISANRLESLLASDPGFSARIYHSLSVTLSNRLREATESRTELNIHDIAQVNRFHSTRLGYITRKQIPDPLIESLDRFDTEMRELVPSESLTEELLRTSASLCDTVVADLATYTVADELVMMGYDDLMAYRDTDQLAIGVGAFVFRETFRWFMLSETIAHSYMKPRGFSDDLITNQRMQTNEPHGDTALGVAIDRWFLDRPFSRSRRSGAQLMADTIAKAVASNSTPFIMSLGSGAAPEIFNYLNNTSQEPIVTLVDIDQAALAAAGEAMERMGLKADINLVEQNVLGLMAGHGRFTVEAQDFIYLPGMLDYLEDGDVVGLLNWIHAKLKPGGVALVSLTNPEHSDRAFLEHILEWMMHYRGKEELERLISDSRFDAAPEWQTEEHRVTSFALLRKK